MTLVSRTQCSALRFSAEPAPIGETNLGPGSAAHRFALRRARDAKLLAAATILSIAMLTPTHGSDTVVLHAAGSLRGALTEVSNAFEKTSGVKVQAKYGVSGLLRDAIAGGEKAEVFASANMEHPAALSKAGKSGPPSLFARNRLCALVKPGLAATSANLLALMLDPAIKLGTSTPKADPSGDYAFEVFRKADHLKAGANDALSGKALQLTGGPSSPTPSSDRSAYGALVTAGEADIFLTYCTGALVAQRENPGQQIVALPDELAVGADYGMTVVNGASENAEKLATFILSQQGQDILAKHGFAEAK